MKKFFASLEWSVMVTNLAVVALLAFALYLTKTPLVLLGLVAIKHVTKKWTHTKTTPDNAQCPKCGHGFVIEPKTKEA